MEFPRGIASSEPLGGGFPPLHVVTDDELLERPGFPDRAREVMQAGGPRLALHLRGPRTGGRRLYEVARELASAARTAGCRFLVNDRCDVAMAVDADGVHLADRSLPPPIARELIGAGKLLGRSVHPPADLTEGLVRPLDYLFVGTIYPTRSHPGREGHGPDVLKSFAEAELPLVGIGGIQPERVADVRRAGAAGVAVLRGVWDAVDPPAAVDEYLRQWSAGEWARTER